MRTRETMTISLPHEMVREVDEVRKREHRTRSELIREALRAYFGTAQALPVYTPTARERREIEKGREEMRRGEYVTTDELFSPLDRPQRKARPESGRTRTAPRARAATRRA